MGLSVVLGESLKKEGIGEAGAFVTEIAGCVVDCLCVNCVGEFGDVEAKCMSGGVFCLVWRAEGTFTLFCNVSPDFGVYCSDVGGWKGVVDEAIG